MKKTGVSIVLVLLFQLSVSADTFTRVEQFHTDKNRHMGIHKKHRPHRLKYRPHRVKPHDYISHYSLGHRGAYFGGNRYRLRHHGLDYVYSSGAFYRPFGSGYRLVKAPIGAIVYTLPVNCTSVVYHDRNYYRYRDTFFVWEGRERGYRIVDAPRRYAYEHYRVGEILETLPYGASAVIIDHVRYYEYHNQYFLPQKRAGVKLYVRVEL